MKKWCHWIVALLSVVAFASLLVLLLLIPPARADSIVVLGLSKHFGTDRQHQERNWGIGYERNGWMTAVYRNSNDRMSVYVIKPIWRYQFTDRLAFVLPVGAATGYSLAVTPVAIPTFTYRATDRLHLDLGVMPALAGKQSILGLQARFELGVSK